MRKSDYTILVVDDDPDYLFRVVFNLEKAGYRTITARSQAEAERILESSVFDLAIFDLMMEQDDSGFVLAHKLRRKHAHIPVIIATAVSSETGMSFGLTTEADRDWIKADSYMEKGMRFEELEREIIKLLDK
jgi:DNA-binding response OmpR family regulator